MNKKELEKELHKLVKLGLLETREVNGELKFKMTQLGERYVELNIFGGGE